MRSYIDEKYFVHFFKTLLKSQRFSDEAKQRETILEFFKGKTDIYLDEDFSTVLNNFDISFKASLSPLINTLTTGRNGTNVYQNQKDQFKVLGTKMVIRKLQFPFATFWLGNKYRYSLKIFRDKSPYYFLSDYDDVELWKKMSKSKTYFVGSGTNPNSSDILSSWDEIKKFAHPFKDIIISDHFSFQNKTGIKENIIPMISSLISIENQIENVLIFTENNKILNNSLEDTHRLIKETLKEFGLKPNVKIYLSYKTPHGRYVITNNLFIEFGNSMDFFDKEKNLKSKGKLNDSSIRIMPIFEVNHSQLKSVLSCLKDISTATDMCYGDSYNTIFDHLT